MADDDARGLRRAMHAAFSKHMAAVLPDPYRGQDSSRMTLVYFVLGAQLVLREEKGGLLDGTAALVDWVYTNQVLPLPGGSSGDSPSSSQSSTSLSDLPLPHCGFRGGPNFGAPWNPAGCAIDDSQQETGLRAWQDRAVKASSPLSDEAASSLPLSGTDLLASSRADAAARAASLGALDADQSHLAMTYTALAVLRMCGDDLSRVDRRAVTSALRQLQLADGSFCPVAGTENDMRFVYCAAVISHLLGDWSGMDRDAATRYILRSQSYDGAIGQGLGQESHGGSTYCAVAALVLMGRLDELPEKDALVHWCVMRQGLGFQGRINKPSDCCYSFWIGATLTMLGHYDLVDFEMVKGHTLACQARTGGFSKIPDVYPDVLHTYMALCGLSLGGDPEVAPIDPALGFRRDIAAQCNSDANPYQVSES
jgi:geranylgeranyl transferase type-1 subunit beta